MAGFKLYIHLFPNGKVYVGITSQTLNRRWRSGYGYMGQPVYNAILKYGWKNIKHIVLFEDLSKEEAEKLEKYYIKKFNSLSHKNGYNVSSGGYNFEEISRHKLSLLGQAKFKNGYKLTENQYKKLLEAHIEATSKPIICLETKKIYKNCEEAQRKTGINATNISRCCRKIKYRNTAGGYHWEYINGGYNK